MYGLRLAVEEIEYEDRSRRNSGTFTNPHPALLKPTSPLTELATAGNYVFAITRKVLKRLNTLFSSFLFQ